jgi:HSP20 family protein
MFIRWSDGLQPAMRLRDEIDRLFNEVVESTAGTAFAPLARRGFPQINLWEDGENLYAEAEVPGLKMENLEVSVLADELTIKGSRPSDEREGVNYHRRERGTGEFCRTVRLPVEIDPDKVQAALRDGVLTITLPKVAACLPRRIEVKG